MKHARNTLPDIERQLARLREAAGVHTDTALAKALGITQGGISSAKRRGKIPDKWLVKTANAYGVYLDWLHSGVGPMRNSSDGSSFPAFSFIPGNEKNAEWGKQRTVPVLGLIGDAVGGWRVPEPLAMNASLTLDSRGNNTFAVIMTGRSMEPDGIRQGHVVYCSHALPPEAGDAVFIELQNGAAAIRRFAGRDEQALRVMGWKDPAPDGRQEPFMEHIDQESVKTLACVVSIRRKA